jgi:hypothetical protein
MIVEKKNIEIPRIELFLLNKENNHSWKNSFYQKLDI